MSASKPEVSELQGKISSLRSRCNLETWIQRTLLFLTSGELRQRIQPVLGDGTVQKKRDKLKVLVGGMGWPGEGY